MITASSRNAVNPQAQYQGKKLKKRKNCVSNSRCRAVRPAEGSGRAAPRNACNRRKQQRVAETCQPVKITGGGEKPSAEIVAGGTRAENFLKKSSETRLIYKIRRYIFRPGRTAVPRDHQHTLFMGGCADLRSIRPLGGFSPPAQRFQAVDGPGMMRIPCLNKRTYMI